MRQFIPYPLCLLLLLGCAPIAIQWDYDPDADFSQYKSFAWMPKPQEAQADNPTGLSPFIEKRLKKAVINNLTARGYHKATDTPDLLIAFDIKVKTKKDVHVHDYGYGYRHWGYPGGTEVRRYKEGTLTVDFFDPRSKELVWRGWSAGPIRHLNNPRESEEYFKQTVNEMLKHFPPY